MTKAEDEQYEGGIDIDKAKKFMSEEDKHDKAAFRQRVKEKHKVIFVTKFIFGSIFLSVNSCFAMSTCMHA